MSRHWRLFAIILTFGILYAQQSSREEWGQISQAQRDSLRATYEWFYPYGFGLTGAANDWQEGDGGLHLISIRVDSTKKVVEIAVGRHQIRIDQTLNDSTSWKISRLAEKHIFDLEFHRREVLKRYQILYRKYGDDWLKVWSHYNSGNGPYGRDMRDKVRFLRSLGWE